MTNPALTAHEGRLLLARELEVRIPKGTFYDPYWVRALERLPESVRQLRRDMVDPRPGKKKVTTSTRERVRVLALVGTIRGDHPDWHQGQIMDEVRQITGIEFRDPVAFARHYIGAVAPGGIGAEVPAAPTLDHPDGAVAATPAHPADPPVDLIAVVQEPVVVGSGTDEDLLSSLLAGADPLKPAELIEAEGGGVELKLTLRPSALARAYRVMSLLYGELASRHEQPPRSD